ncbi:MAG TPA: SUMF1/EgtB/PvdO family nonheme iron enzyme [Candidatus Paceibacterota bacterium]|nr:SUMF1/EgtB/PvdO family nonheme iron enzyme [Verrucomicrobiota bacterium]HRY49156.1 SUMF1/EgtB/PvdO family nonheme iron enzyme [Candidatus Paceibacterota bacterium]HSA00134.1 SUMF1/EgtB/PvdO family nonheme iron enzyme [Candidatus Paceibacterota bacterium]
MKAIRAFSILLGILMLDSALQTVDLRGASQDASAAPAKTTSAESVSPTQSLDPSPHLDSPRTNSLGVVLIRIPGHSVWIAAHETRVQEFTAFTLSTGYQTEPVRWKMRYGGWEQRDWRQPGFPQTPSHPVIFVSYIDAEQFCQWLTRVERTNGLITARESYRLPKDEEWSLAVGSSRYPWGARQSIANSTPAMASPGGHLASDRLVDLKAFPPPLNAGNYAGSEFQDPNSSRQRTLRDYRDPFPQTAPVGSFPPNALGIFDLGGNVAEWCLDWYHRDLLSPELEDKVPFYNNDGGGRQYRVVRGASWIDSHPALLRADCRFFEFPEQRSDHIGFRIVLTGQP